MEHTNKNKQTLSIHYETLVKEHYKEPVDEEIDNATARGSCTPGMEELACMNYLLLCNHMRMHMTSHTHSVLIECVYYFKPYCTIKHRIVDLARNL